VVVSAPMRAIVYARAATPSVTPYVAWCDSFAVRVLVQPNR
jgi:hypothetical protein